MPELQACCFRRRCSSASGTRRSWSGNGTLGTGTGYRPRCRGVNKYTAYTFTWTAPDHSARKFQLQSAPCTLVMGSDWCSRPMLIGTHVHDPRRPKKYIFPTVLCTGFDSHFGYLNGEQDYFLHTRSGGYDFRDGVAAVRELRRYFGVVLAHLTHALIPRLYHSTHAVLV